QLACKGRPAARSAGSHPFAALRPVEPKNGAPPVALRAAATDHLAARHCYFGQMSENGGKRQPKPTGDSRDDRLAEISNALAEMSSHLTSLAHEVRDLQGPPLSDEQRYQRQP